MQMAGFVPGVNADQNKAKHVHVSVCVLNTLSSNLHEVHQIASGFLVHTHTLVENKNRPGETAREKKWNKGD